MAEAILELALMSQPQKQPTQNQQGAILLLHQKVAQEVLL